MSIANIRRKIGATISAYYTLDADLQAFWDMEGSVNMAAAAAIEAWALQYSANPDNEHIGDYSYSQKIIDNMLKMAERLRKTESETPSITWAEPNLLMTEEAE